MAVDANSGNITLDKPPPGGTVQPTGDLGSGSRYFLENAPEYLAPGSGTFFADSTTILYSPLDAEARTFDQLDVVAAIPGLFELVSPPVNGSSSGVTLENLEFSHTDVDFATCFATDCDEQAVSSQTTAALHFEFADQISLSNVTIEHVGGYALWFGPGVRHSRFSSGRLLDMGAGGVRIGEAVSFENHTDNRTVRNITVEDAVLHDGGNVFRAGMGVLLQAAADCTITHNEVSMFRQTGISLGWRWNYGPTSNGNSTVSYNNISTIGMGETSDLGCVYHLGEDPGTVIHGNLCYNVSSFDYGAIAYYLDQSSRYVTVSNNVAYDVKCAGFLENFVMNCTILNNVFAFVNENEFWPGADFSGQTCFPNTGAAIYAPEAGSWNGEPCRRSFMKPCYSAFNFSKNIIYWRHGQLFGGGSAILSSTWWNNVYFNIDESTALRSSGFPCPDSFGPFNPATADGILYENQRLLAGAAGLWSHSRTAWARVEATNGSFCVGAGKKMGEQIVWCTPAWSPGRDGKGPNSTFLIMQADGNLCVEDGSCAGKNPSCSSFCASSCSPHGCPALPGEFYAQLHDNCTFCVYRQGALRSVHVTWCSPGFCNPHPIASAGIAAGASQSHDPALASTQVQGCSFAAWQEKGYDKHSEVADPLFVSPATRDFRLRPDSPALRMGIESLDTSRVGPRHH